MAEATSVISQAMRDAVGVTSEPRVWDVEKGAIAKFARAIGDPNPVYLDEREARKTPLRGIVAPPTFLRLLRPGPHRATYEQPLPNILDGGSQYKFFEPLRAGDRITVTATLAEVFEKQGKLGAMLFRVHEIRYVNQLGDLVAVQRTTTINYGEEG